MSLLTPPPRTQKNRPIYLLTGLRVSKVSLVCCIQDNSSCNACCSCPSLSSALSNCCCLSTMPLSNADQRELTSVSGALIAAACSDDVRSVSSWACLELEVRVKWLWLLSAKWIRDGFRLFSQLLKRGSYLISYTYDLYRGYKSLYWNNSDSKFIKVLTDVKYMVKPSQILLIFMSKTNARQKNEMLVW